MMPSISEKISSLWSAGRPFFLSGVVSAPYMGCYHEPNLWLITPAAWLVSDEGEDMREAAANFGGSFLVPGTDQIIWPLYASGAGLDVNEISTLELLLAWLEDHESMGEIDSFSAGKASDGIDQMPPDEHYWTQAVRIAQEAYDIAIPWTCSACDEKQEGSDEAKCAPYNTSSRGNGGVGVFMSGALCWECMDAGMCCSCSAGSHHDSIEAWDLGVYEHGWDLCEFCTERAIEEAKKNLDLLGVESGNLITDPDGLLDMHTTASIEFDGAKVWIYEDTEGGEGGPETREIKLLESVRVNDMVVEHLLNLVDPGGDRDWIGVPTATLAKFVGE